MEDAKARNCCQIRPTAALTLSQTAFMKEFERDSPKPWINATTEGATKFHGHLANEPLLWRQLTRKHIFTCKINSKQQPAKTMLEECV